MNNMSDLVNQTSGSQGGLNVQYHQKEGRFSATMAETHGGKSNLVPNFHTTGDMIY